MRKYISTLTIIIFTLLLMTGCNGKPKVDLNKYITIDVENGKVIPDFDLDSFGKDYGDKIQFNENPQNKEEWAFLQMFRNEKEKPYKALFDVYLGGDFDKTQNLKSGDVVTFTWHINDELVQDIFNCELVYSDITHTVTDEESVDNSNDSNEETTEIEDNAENTIDENADAGTDITPDDDKGIEEEDSSDSVDSVQEIDMDSILKAYQDYIKDTYLEKFLFAYVDGDDIPELFAQTELEEHILQYQDGKVIDVGYDGAGTHFYYKPRKTDFVDVGSDGETGYITYYKELNLLTSDMANTYYLESHRDLYQAELDKIEAEYEDAGEEMMYGSVEEAFENLK